MTANPSARLADGKFGYTRSGLSVPPELAEVRHVGDIVLDPTCGSGTMAEAALKLGRRFIVIDRHPEAIRITSERIQRLCRERGDVPMVRRDGRRHEVRCLNWLDLQHDIPNWDDGDSYIVLGDAIQVLRTMPDSFVELVYADPPFGKQQVFRGPRGEFSDIWTWDEAAEARMAELEDMPAELWEGGDRNLGVGVIHLLRTSQPDMASYLTWIALLLLECRRVMGRTEYVEVPRGPWTL